MPDQRKNPPPLPPKSGGLADLEHLLRNKDYQKAVAILRGHLEKNPKDIKYWLKLGDVFLRAGQEKEAIVPYQHVAEHYDRERQHKKSAAVYRQLIKLEPENATFWVGLGKASHALELTGEAMSAFLRAAQVADTQHDTDGAITILQSALEVDPSQVPVRVLLAEAYSKASRSGEAATAFAHAANELEALGRVDEYLKVAERLLFHRKDDMSLARKLAEIYLRRGMYGESLSKLQILFQKDANDTTTLDMLAQAFAGLKQTDKAVMVYQEMLKLYAAAGRKVEEAQTVDKILMLRPDHPDFQMHRSAKVTSVPTDTDETGWEESAKPESTEVNPQLSVTSQKALIVRMMAECDVYVRYGLLPKAIEQLEQVLAMDPHYPDAVARLQQLYTQVGQTDKAKHLLRTITQAQTRKPVAPSKPVAAKKTITIESVLEEVELFVLQGRYAEAVATLEDGLATFSGHTLLRERMAEVQFAMAQAQHSSSIMPEADFEFVEEVSKGLQLQVSDADEALNVDALFSGFTQSNDNVAVVEDSDTHFDLGIAYREMGLYDEAIDEFRRAQVNPYKECMASTLIGVCFRDKGDAAQAIKEFKRGLQSSRKTESEELALYYELGSTYDLMQDSKEARYYFEIVAKRDPTFRRVRDRLQRLRTEGTQSIRYAVEREDVDRAFDALIEDERTDLDKPPQR